MMAEVTEGYAILPEPTGCSSEGAARDGCPGTNETSAKMLASCLAVSLPAARLVPGAKIGSRLALARP
jgi:hypothetical protein